MYVTLSHDSHHSSIINLLRKINVVIKWCAIDYCLCVTYILIKKL